MRAVMFLKALIVSAFLLFIVTSLILLEDRDTECVKAGYNTVRWYNTKVCLDKEGNPHLREKE